MALSTKNTNIKAEFNFPEWHRILTGEALGYDGAMGAASLYNSVALFRQCLKLRCDAISGIPYVLTDKNGEETSWTKEFPGTSLQELIWKTEAAFLLTGQAYWEITKNPYGYTKGVSFVNPYQITYEYEAGQYTFTYSDGVNQQRFVNRIWDGEYELVFFKEFNPTSDVLHGKGDAQVAGISAKLMHEIIRYPERFLAGGAMPVTMLGIDGGNDDDIKRVESWVKRAGARIGDFWERILGVRAGTIAIQTLTPPVKDLELAGLRDLAWLDIIVAFGVPDSMVRSNAANYATAVNDRKSFYEDKLAPRAARFASVINEQLLEPFGGLHLEFDISKLSLFQEDQEKRASLWKQLREGGTPIVMAYDLADVKLTEEQREELEAHVDETPTTSTPPISTRKTSLQEELERWQRMAEKRVKAGKAIRAFESEVIPLSLKASIEGALAKAKSTEDVKSAFAFAAEWEDYP